MRFLSEFVSTISLAMAVLAAVSCPPSPSCTAKGAAAVLASALNTYAPAQTYCSSKYPLPLQTCTSTAPAVTTTHIGATAYVDSTVATTITIVTDPTSTSTYYDRGTYTRSTTQIITVTAAAKRRRAQNTARAVDPQSAALSSLKAQASSLIGAVCTCIEKPATTTITITPTVVAEATATSVNPLTATSTSTYTPITVLTYINFRSYTTITYTATTTIPPPPNRTPCAATDDHQYPPYINDCEGIEIACFKGYDTQATCDQLCTDTPGCAQAQYWSYSSKPNNPGGYKQCLLYKEDEYCGFIG